jgi:molybdopterin molybdotransferase
VDLGLVGDDPRALEKAIGNHLGDLDFLVTSGGVSVGDRDFTRDVLGRLGRVTHRKVAMKPGKPQVVGELDGKPVFGLPGNPVSSLVVFEVFVLPALRTLAGHSQPLPPRFAADLTQNVKHSPSRAEFLRVRLVPQDGRWTATPTGPQGSGILTSMTLSNGYAIIPRGTGDVSAGTAVPCMAAATRF